MPVFVVLTLLRTKGIASPSLLILPRVEIICNYILFLCYLTIPKCSLGYNYFFFPFNKANYSDSSVAAKDKMTLLQQRHTFLGINNN